MKKNKKRSLGNINFSSADVSAIVCVLPLVAQIETETPVQNLLNIANTNSAAEKLLNHKSALSANEIRVISIAISAALSLVVLVEIEHTTATGDIQQFFAFRPRL